MLKLIVGRKGNGKTKLLIALANAAAAESKGAVVVIERGNHLIHEIDNTARLVDANEYAILGGDQLYGFLAGAYASNYDITDMFLDATLKAVDITDFEAFAQKVAALAEKNGFNVYVTVSMPIEELPASLAGYVYKA